jgi:tetratricopeptide (TPR) repeat protein
VRLLNWFTVASLFNFGEPASSNKLARQKFLDGQRGFEAAASILHRATLLAMYAGEYQKAVFFGERMLALANQLGNPRLKLLAAIRLQVAFDYIRNFTKAVEYVELGFELIRELPENSLDQSWFVIILLQHRGDSYQQLGKYEQAVEWYRRAIDAADAYVRLHAATDRLQAGRRVLSAGKLRNGVGELPTRSRGFPGYSIQTMAGEPPYRHRRAVAPENYFRTSCLISWKASNSGSLCSKVAPWTIAVAAIQLSATDRLPRALRRAALSRISLSQAVH